MKNKSERIMRPWKPLTTNQKDYVISMCENIVTIGAGCAGSGKTFLALALALEHLLSNKIDKILICRPMISAGNNSQDFPSLPGSIAEKIHPYMLPYLDYLEYFLDRGQVKHLIETGKIELTPCELLRGRTYGNSNSSAVMILEESQNCTPKQIKLFLTRLGANSSAIIIGDEKQSDLFIDNGLDFLLNTTNIANLKDVGVIRFNYQDIQRNKIIGHILEEFEKYGV